MTTILILVVFHWLLFNLFLFAWLGPQRSADLSKSIIDNFRASLRR